MNAKKTVAAVCGVMTAVAAMAYSGPAKAPPGKDNVAFGYGAGYNSSGQNTNVVCIGTDAGIGSSNNKDCIFIGANAGESVANTNGYIDIGGVFMSDGANIILAPKNISTGKIYVNAVITGKRLATTEDCETVANDKIYALQQQHPATFASLKGSYVNAGSVQFDDDDVRGVTTNNGKIKFYNGQVSVYIGTEGYASGYSIDDYILTRDTAEWYLPMMKFEDGGISVYTNGVKAGTLSFTPAQ